MDGVVRDGSKPRWEGRQAVASRRGAGLEFYYREISGETEEPSCPDARGFPDARSAPATSAIRNSRSTSISPRYGAPPPLPLVARRASLAPRLYRHFRWLLEILWQTALTPGAESLYAWKCDSVSPG